MAERFQAAGHSVVVIAIDPSVEDFFDIGSIAQVKALPVHLVGRRGMHSALGRARALRRLLVECDPHIAISFLWRTNVLALVASFNSPWATVISERNDPWREANAGHHLWHWLRKRLYKHANGVVANTTGAVQYLERVVGLNAPVYIPNAVASSVKPKETAGSLEGEATSGGINVLAVGRLSHQKGFDALLASWPRVVADFPEARLAVVGDGPDRLALEQKIEILGLKDSVFLEGAVSDVDSYYSRADVFVLSSRWEGFPNALLEAMSWGLPCIATDCSSGVADCLGDAGILVPLDSPKELSSALCSLLYNPAQRQQLSGLARKRITAFEADAVFAQWENLIELTVTQTDILLVAPRAHTNLHPVLTQFKQAGLNTKIVTAPPRRWTDQRADDVTVKKLIRQISKLKPKFVVLREVAQSAGLIGWYCRFRGTKYALLSQENPQKAASIKGQIKALYGWAYRLARFGATKTYTPVLPNSGCRRPGFVPFNYPMPAVIKRSKPDCSIATVLMVGKLAVPRKRHEDVVEALADLPFKSTLKIVGSSDGNLQNNPRRSHDYFLRIMSFDGRSVGNTTVSVLADTPFEDMSDLYAEADIFVLPASDEPFAVSVLEAMAAGCAVIATKENGSASYLTHGENGLVYSAGDRAALSALLNFLLLDLDYARKLGEKAQKMVIMGGNPRYLGMMEALGIDARKT